MSESDTEQKIGPETPARMKRRLVILAERPAEPQRLHVVGVSSGGTPVWLLNEVASAEAKITIGRARRTTGAPGAGAS